MRVTEVPADHSEFLELLPWYVNGTLADDVRAALDQHLKDCLTCNAALRVERRLCGLVQDQDTVPLGPEHGINDLLRRIESKDGPRVKWSRNRAPVLGYGLAAALGGAVIWVLVSLPNIGPAPDDETFATLSTGHDSGPYRIDVVFVASPKDAELTEFLKDTDTVLVAGPSALGRYTFDIGTDSEDRLAELLEQLNNDPRIQFAGRTFIPASPPEADE